MRLPFTKSATPRPELTFPSLTDMDGSFEFTAPSPSPEIGLALSPNARNSALQLVGTIREILVGDQIRTLDTRFASLHHSIEGNVSSYIEEISNSIEGIQSALRAEITETRGTIAENAARFDFRNEATSAEVARTSERTIALEANLETRTNVLIQEDIRIARNLESTAMRLTSVEENLNHSVAQLQGEDALIAGALEDGIARVVAAEKRIAESIERLERLEMRQFATQEDALNGAARIVALEETLNAITETIHNRNSALVDQVNTAIARASMIESNLTNRIQELYAHVSSSDQATAAAAASADRIASLEEIAENLRIGFNKKMSELCDYVIAQVERVERHQAPLPPQAPTTPAPAVAASRSSAPMTARPSAPMTAARPIPDTRPAASMFTPPAAATPAVSAAPAPALRTTVEFPSFPSFPKFPTFPTFPSNDSPNQYPQSGFRA